VKQNAWLSIALVAVLSGGCGHVPYASSGPLPIPPAINAGPAGSHQAARDWRSARSPNDTAGQTKPVHGGQNTLVPASHISPVAAEPSSGAFAAARALEKQGKFPEALAAYEELSSSYPSHAPVLHRLAILHDRIGDPQKSLEYYRAAAKLSPRDPELLCDLGYSRYLQGDYALAERSLRLALKLNPGMTRAHNNLALVMARRGEDQQALAAFQQAGMTKDQATENLQNARLASQRSYTQTAQ
jgi:tetratricopeptide (TPR) repeat protein